MRSHVFTPMTFDFLWEQARAGEQPYPIQVPSHGETMDERSALRRAAMAELASDGSLDRSGSVEPQLESWLLLLSQPTLSVDSICLAGQDAQASRALAASDGEVAVLATQDADGIALREIYPDALASEIVALLPRCDRGTHRSVTMSLDDALRTPSARVKVPANRSESPADKADSGLFGFLKPAAPTASRKPLSQRSAGSAAQDYAMLAAQPRLAGGQFGANSRDEVGAKQRAPVLAWFDTPTGRYLSLTREGPDGHQWVTISPADAKTLRSRLSEMLATVAGAG